MNSLHRSCHITKWQNRDDISAVKLEIQNEMEKTVLDKGKDSLILVDYTSLNALRKYESI